MEELRELPDLSSIDPIPQDDASLQGYWDIASRDVGSLEEDDYWHARVAMSSWLRRFTGVRALSVRFSQSESDDSDSQSTSLLRDAPGIARFLVGQLGTSNHDTALLALGVASDSSCAFATCLLAHHDAEDAEEQLELLDRACFMLPNPTDLVVMEFVAYAQAESERLQPIVDRDQHLALEAATQEKINSLMEGGGLEAVYQWAESRTSGLTVYPEALHGWSWAAERGHVRAMGSLGSYFLQSNDLDQARVWLSRSADNGNAVSMGSMGVLCRREGNSMAAEDWFRRGAEAGDRFSANQYASCLTRKGHLRAACGWFEFSHDFGNALRIEEMIKNGAKDSTPKPPRKWF